MAKKRAVGWSTSKHLAIITIVGISEKVQKYLFLRVEKGATVPSITNLSQFPLLSAPLIALMRYHYSLLILFLLYFQHSFKVCSCLALGQMLKMCPIFVTSA